jgi:hypothetical protein
MDYMGKLRDFLTGEPARRRHLEILARKNPATRGVSAGTAAALEAGEVELVDDGNPSLALALEPDTTKADDAQ